MALSYNRPHIGQLRDPGEQALSLHPAELSFPHQPCILHRGFHLVDSFSNFYFKDNISCIEADLKLSV